MENLRDPVNLVVIPGLCIALPEAFIRWPGNSLYLYLVFLLVFVFVIPGLCIALPEAFIRWRGNLSHSGLTHIAQDLGRGVVGQPLHGLGQQHQLQVGQTV